jgi:hypothetical protein
MRRRFLEHGYGQVPGVDDLAKEIWPFHITVAKSEFPCRRTEASSAAHARQEAIE